MENCFNRIGLIVLLLYLAKPMAKAGGLSAFEEKTPYNNTLSYDGSSSYLVYFDFTSQPNLATKLVYFKSFYFYKGHIIGKADSAFFVVNEAKLQMFKFKNSEQFEKYLLENSLKPSIWTRWYDFRYDLANFKDWPLLLIGAWPFVLLLLAMFIYSLATLKKNKHKILYNAKIAYLALCIGFVLFVYLFQIFPQSI